MNNLIINKNKIHLRNKEGDDLYAISKIKYKEIPSLLPGQISGILGIKEDSIKRNRLRNHDKFREGLEIFTISGVELIDFMDSLCGTRSHSQNHNDLPAFDPSKNPKKIRELTLYTYEGFLNMVKIVNTSEAWEIYDILKDCYFKMKSLGYRAKVTPEKYIESRDTRKEFISSMGNYRTSYQEGTINIYDGLFQSKGIKKPNMNGKQIDQLLRAERLAIQKSDTIDYPSQDEGNSALYLMGNMIKSFDDGDMKSVIGIAEGIKKKESEKLLIDSKKSDNYFDPSELWNETPKQIETNNVPEKIISRRKKQYTIDVIDGTICKIDKDGNRRRISKEEREVTMKKK